MKLPLFSIDAINLTQALGTGRVAFYLWSNRSKSTTIITLNQTGSYNGLFQSFKRILWKMICNTDIVKKL